MVLPIVLLAIAAGVVALMMYGVLLTLGRIDPPRL